MSHISPRHAFCCPHHLYLVNFSATPEQRQEDSLDLLLAAVHSSGRHTPFLRRGGAAEAKQNVRVDLTGAWVRQSK